VTQPHVTPTAHGETALTAFGAALAILRDPAAPPNIPKGAGFARAVSKSVEPVTQCLISGSGEQLISHETAFMSARLVERAAAAALDEALTAFTDSLASGKPLSKNSLAKPRADFDAARDALNSVEAARNEFRSVLHSAFQRSLAWAKSKQKKGSKKRLEARELDKKAQGLMAAAHVLRVAAAHLDNDAADGDGGGASDDREGTEVSPHGKHVLHLVHSVAQFTEKVKLKSEDRLLEAPWLDPMPEGEEVERTLFLLGADESGPLDFYYYDQPKRKKRKTQK